MKDRQTNLSTKGQNPFLDIKVAQSLHSLFSVWLRDELKLINSLISEVGGTPTPPIP